MTSAVSVTCRENLFVIVSNQKKKRKKRERPKKIKYFFIEHNKEKSYLIQLP